MDQICATQAPSRREAVLDQEEQKSAKKGGKQLARTIKAASDILELNQEDFESASVAESNMSAKTGKTSKTTSGALDKHCGLCNKRISGRHWSVHNNKIHSGKATATPCTHNEC